jgi:transposase
VPFAIPLYRIAALLRRHAVELAAEIVAGSGVAVVSSALLARALGLGPVEAASMIAAVDHDPVRDDGGERAGRLGSSRRCPSSSRPSSASWRGAC